MISVGRIVSNSSLQHTKAALQHRIIHPCRDGSKRIHSIMAVANCGLRNYTFYEDAPSSHHDEFTPSSPSSSTSYVVWGVAATMFGLTTQYYSTNNQRRHNMRGYHSTKFACCESRSSTNSSKQRKGNTNGSSRSDESEGKSDSFFDMAQQWASDYTSSTGRGENNNEDSTARCAHDNQETNNNESSSIQTPEAALLEAMGILGGSNHDGSEHNKEDTNNNSKEEDDDKKLNNLQGMMQKFLFKFDDFKSSLPNDSTIQANKDTNNASESPLKSETEQNRDNDTSLFSEFLSFANNASLFTKKTSSASPDIEELIEQAQNIVANSVSSSLPEKSSTSASSSTSSSSFLSQVRYFQQNAQAIQQVFDTNFGPHLSNINVKDLFKSFPVAALHYYLEYQDSIKTPSWKRRMHRYYSDVEVSKVEELNEALILSELSYADSVEEIRVGLERIYNNSNSGVTKKNNKPQWELLFCDTESRPNQPSHFLAIQKNASPYDDALHVLLVVRGTKSMSDLITDALMEASDYEYTPQGMSTTIKGKAHGGMQSSGKYLVDRHQKLLSTLLQLSKKRKLQITVIGHSLGAGAATIAAMEWNSGSKFGQDSDVSANVIGFGCPALLSRGLSLSTKEYVTTVIADADFIPRMSAATLVNLLLDVKSFDYRKQAERDVEQALRQLTTVAETPIHENETKSKLAFGLDENDIRTVMGYVRSGLEKVANPISAKETIEADTINENMKEDQEGRTVEVEKMKPILFPPGTCIHFYRDGSGITGSYCPCDFFNELDVARTMVDDHLISSGYRRIFLNLMRNFTKDDHFSFDRKYDAADK